MANLAQRRQRQVEGAAIMGEYPEYVTENLSMAFKLKKNREQLLRNATANAIRFPNDPVLNNRILTLRQQLGRINRYVQDPVQFKNYWNEELEGLYRQTFRGDLGQPLVFY